MSERVLANALKIKIVDEIGAVDLPWFLFEQLDAVLNELNYYKVSNLYENIAQYKKYLQWVAKNYLQYVHELQTSSEESLISVSHRTYNFEPFMTQELYNQNFVFHIGKQQLIGTTKCILCKFNTHHERVYQQENSSNIAYKTKSDEFRKHALNRLAFSRNTNVYMTMIDTSASRQKSTRIRTK